MDQPTRGVFHALFRERGVKIPVPLPSPYPNRRFLKVFGVIGFYAPALFISGQEVRSSANASVY